MVGGDLKKGRLKCDMTDLCMLLKAASELVTGGVGDGVSRIEGRGEGALGSPVTKASSSSREMAPAPTTPVSLSVNPVGTGRKGSPTRLPCRRSNGLGKRERTLASASESDSDLRQSCLSGMSRVILGAPTEETGRGMAPVSGLTTLM